MRRWVWISLAVLLLLLVYYGSAVVSVAGLARAVQAGNGAAVLAHTDQVALRRSLVSQVLDAYLHPATREKPASSRDRFLAQTVGATVADAMVAKFLTAESLTQILRDGNVAATADTPAVTIPDMASLRPDDISDVMSRVRPSGLTRIAVRLSREADGDNYYGARLQFGSSGWLLSDLKLPRHVLRDLADKVGVRPAE